jgi:hypothetical protein
MGKKIHKEIKSFLSEYSLDFSQELNSQNLLDYFNRKLTENNLDPKLKKSMNSAIEKLVILESIEFHRSVAQRQRNVYNRYRTYPSFLRGKILIDIIFLKARTREISISLSFQIL